MSGELFSSPALGDHKNQTHTHTNYIYTKWLFVPSVTMETVYRLSTGRSEDGKAVLPCAVHHLGTKHVTWRRLGDNHFLSVGDLTWVKDPNIDLQYNELTPEVTEWNLVIKKVTPQHIGTYECRISDRVQLVRFIHLDVVGPPVVEAVTFPPIAISGRNYVEMGQPIHLFCNTTGPNGIHLSIDWFKDGDRIDHINYRHVVITNYNLLEPNVRVSELLIDRSKASDTGTYICRSANGYIDSMKVTVLFADTTNVKREAAEQISQLTLWSLTGWSMQLSYPFQLGEQLSQLYNHINRGTMLMLKRDSEHVWTCRECVKITQLIISNSVTSLIIIFSLYMT
ncbi:unnamed protein product [Candidula unifasciata]|uniref:Ig-like domain-containing protein n=1 Tax=Candidula unifasciata TaxID=100452 RepID=A0A8S3YMX7_9EUPU|nr:unnamed protein product [Candidula unifasciata]